MKFLTSIFLLFVSFNSYSQFKLNVVDSMVMNKKYKSSDVKELSKEISSDFKSDSNKIRAFYIYIVNNINYDISLSKRLWRPKSQSDMDSIILSEVNNCVKTKKGICWDYSALFQKLCFYQGIEVEQIGGTNRYTEIMPENKIGNHSWNVLVINGKRKFIDCTFECPKEYDKAEFDKFYLVDPEDFIYRCFPDDSAKQYLEKIVTYRQFKSLPYARNGFFEHKIKNIVPNLFYIKIKADAQYSITFQIANIDKLTSIEIYKNNKLVQTSTEINYNMNLKLNTKLLPDDKINVMAVKNISKDNFTIEESIAPLVTYIAK